MIHQVFVDGVTAGVDRTVDDDDVPHFQLTDLFFGDRGVRSSTGVVFAEETAWFSSFTWVRFFIVGTASG